VGLIASAAIYCGSPRRGGMVQALERRKVSLWVRGTALKPSIGHSGERETAMLVLGTASRPLGDLNEVFGITQ
jgi:hypothetical protein